MKISSLKKTHYTVSTYVATGWQFINIDVSSIYTYAYTSTESRITISIYQHGQKYMGEVSNKSFLAKKTWNNIMLIVLSVSS